MANCGERKRFQSYGNYDTCPSCQPIKAKLQCKEAKPTLFNMQLAQELDPKSLPSQRTPWGLKYPHHFSVSLNNASRLPGDTNDNRERMRSIYDVGVQGSSTYASMMPSVKNPLAKNTRPRYAYDTNNSMQRIQSVYGPGKYQAAMAIATDPYEMAPTIGIPAMGKCLPKNQNDFENGVSVAVAAPLSETPACQPTFQSRNLFQNNVQYPSYGSYNPSTFNSAYRMNPYQSTRSVQGALQSTPNVDHFSFMAAQNCNNIF